MAWLAVHYSVGAGAGALPHPAEAWLMRLHGLAGFAALFVLGALAAVAHPARLAPDAAPRRLHQRGSGVALCALGALLVLTAYLLYYFAPENLRPALGWLHSATGLAMAGIVVAHRRRRVGKSLRPDRD